MARPLGEIMIERNKGLELAVPIGSLEAYTQAVNRVPMLTAEEERALASRLRDLNDLEAARQLILAQQRFEVRVARGYDGYGLLKAVKRFIPDMNVRLVSFAVHWIRAEIHEFILRNWRIVKVATTKAQRKLFFNLRSAKTRLGWFTRDEVNAVAKDLGVSPETVVEMESRMSGYDASLYGETDDDGNESHTAPIAYLADMRADPAAQLESEDWEDHHSDKLHAALEDLDERSRDILSRRWLADNKATLHELADKYRVSAERIRQLEQNAIKKLKAVLAV